MNRFLVSIIVLSVILMTSCAKPPVEKMDAAKTALLEAKNAEASVYAPESLKAAEEKAAALEQELSIQKGKFFKNYKMTTQLATESLDMANKAKTDAEKAKDAAKNEADTTIKGAEAVITEAREALKTAPTGKKSTVDIAPLTSEIDAAAADIEQAKKDLADSKFTDAKTKAEEAKDKAEKIKIDIQTAVEASKTKNGKKK
jgi:hypothetical protein